MNVALPKSDQKVSLAVLQGLRGIAALLVVVWHGSSVFGPYGEGLPGRLLKPGSALGVDLFFLISGFIMVHTTFSLTGTWKDARVFFTKRLIRIWPLYIAATLLFAVLHFWVLKTRPPLASVEWLLRSLFFLPPPVHDWMSEDMRGYPFLGVGWTLNYEMLFYVLFALSLAFRRYRWISLIVLLVAAGMGLPFLFLFAAGVGIGIVFQRDVRLPAKLRLPVLLLTAAGVIAQYSLDWRTQHGVDNWGLSLIPFLTAVVLSERANPLWTPPPLKKLGDWSYSLYILHPFVVDVFMRLRGQEPETFAANMLSLTVIVTMSVIIAAGSYYLFEKWLSDYLRARLVKNTR